MLFFIASFVSLAMGLVVVGFVAGLSLMLYSLQITLLRKPGTRHTSANYLVLGVACGITLLGVLFLVTLPETSPISTLTSSLTERTSLLDVLIGLFCLGAGVYFLLRSQKSRHSTPQEAPSKPHIHASTKLGDAAFFGIGFLRAVSRVSGVAALLLGVKMIVSFSDSVLVRSAWLAFLLAAAIVPYGVIFLAHRRHPAVFVRIQQLLSRFSRVSSSPLLAVFLLIVGAVFLTSAFF